MIKCKECQYYRPAYTLFPRIKAIREFAKCAAPEDGSIYAVINSMFPHACEPDARWFQPREKKSWLLRFL